ncbi:MAG: Ig-like domain-containing protein [Ruminococcus flavefaciens]|nr:Ig-like domain-containing protein [Ruminococcus flavefaciens]
MQNKNNTKNHTKERGGSADFEELLADDRFDDEDADSVTEDTLEFLSLDDEAIETWQKTHAPEKKAVSTGKAPVRVVEVFEDEDDEDYEDEDYEDEDYEDEEDDEDYEDEDYEDEEDDDGDYEEYDDDDGFAARLRYFISEMNGLDVAVAVLGIIVLVGVFATGGIYLHARSTQKQVEAFANVGEELAGVSVIGESGLIAVTESARLGNMIDVEEPEEETPEASYVEADGEVEVELHLTSILSDMKIKLVNSGTGKLIGGVPFEVEVSGTKSFQLKDEDKDGVIYQTGIDAGTYEVKLLPFPADVADKYKLPAKSSSVKVTDQIAYQKVDVADEVKSESEVNVAKEEATQQNTVEESALTDTVEWVESTKTPIGDGEISYEEVSKDQIPDPWKTGAGAFRKMVEDGEEDDPYERATSSLNQSSLTLDKGGSGTLKISVSEDVSYSVEWSVSDTSVITVSDGTVTAVAPGTATVTARVVIGSKVQEHTCTVTVKGDDGAGGGDKDKEDQDKDKDKDQDKDKDKDQDKDKDKEQDKDKDNGQSETVYQKIKISGGSEVSVGKTVTLTARTEPEGGKITWESENAKIAKVDENGVVTGVSEGSVKILARCKGKEEIMEPFEIKVVKAAVTVDGKAKLKDKDGSQLYYKDGDGTYKEATYQDYKERDKFFKQVKTASAYRYTGWQTIDGHLYYYDKNGNYVTGDQVIQGARYTFGSDGKLQKSSGTMGIDVSKHNGNIDWNAVKNSGVSYVIIRCGYRGYSTGVLVEDPKFHSNIKGAKAAGLKVGAYFFSQAVNEVEAVEEASMAIDLVKGYGLNYPLFLDVEGSGGRADGISRDMRTAVCNTFCQTVQNSGISAGVYANKTWFTEKINTASLTNYKLWLAQYASEPTYTATRYDLWQYSSKGRVSGISTNVDMNISYVNY